MLGKVPVEWCIENNLRRTSYYTSTPLFADLNSSSSAQSDDFTPSILELCCIYFAADANLAEF